jgi:hypothetical protein
MLRWPAKFAFLLSLGVFAMGALADTTPAPEAHKAVHHKPAKSKAAKAKAGVARVAEAKKKAPPPEPVEIPPMSPEQLPAQAPQVSFQGGRLSVTSENSTMKDILEAIRKQAGMQMDLPASMGSDRVAAHLAGLPRDVIASLLEGTSWDYIIVGSPTDSDRIQELIVTSAGGGVASGLSRGANFGLMKKGGGGGPIPGEPGVAQDDQQMDAEDQPAADDNAEQPESEQPPANDETQPAPPAGQPPQAQVPPGQNPANSYDPNQPQSIDQFNNNMRRQIQQQKQQQQPQQ